MATKICYNRSCSKYLLEQPLSNFIRRNKSGNKVIHRICNNCGVIKKISTKICLNPGCKFDKIAQPLSEFKRPNALGKLVVRQICNDCVLRERIELENAHKSLVKSLIVEKPKRKPVWLVVYRSFP